MITLDFYINLTTKKIVRPDNTKVLQRDYTFTEGEIISGNIHLVGNTGTITKTIVELAEKSNHVALANSTVDDDYYSISLNGALIRNYLYDLPEKKSYLSLTVTVGGVDYFIYPVPVKLVSNPTNNNGVDVTIEMIDGLRSELDTHTGDIADIVSGNTEVASALNAQYSVNAQYAEYASDVQTGSALETAINSKASQSSVDDIVSGVTPVAIAVDATNATDATFASAAAVGSELETAINSKASVTELSAAAPFPVGLFNDASTDIAIGAIANGRTGGISIGSGSTGHSGGIAVGIGASGYTDGTALGTNTKASSNGVAVGYQAQGSYYGVGIGNLARGSQGVSIGSDSEGKFSGVAVGRNSFGTGAGNVAVGLSAVVTTGLYDTTEIGTGTATVAGALHYRGNAIVDGSGNWIGPVVENANNANYASEAASANSAGVESELETAINSKADASTVQDIIDGNIQIGNATAAWSAAAGSSLAGELVAKADASTVDDIISGATVVAHADQANFASEASAAATADAAGAGSDLELAINSKAPQTALDYTNTTINDIIVGIVGVGVANTAGVASEAQNAATGSNLESALNSKANQSAVDDIVNGTTEVGAATYAQSAGYASDVSAGSSLETLLNEKAYTSTLDYYVNAINGDLALKANKDNPTFTTGITTSAVNFGSLFKYQTVTETRSGVTSTSLWLLANAYYDETDGFFYRIDVNNFSFGLQIQASGTIPGEEAIDSHNQGYIIWKANPTNNILGKKIGCDASGTFYGTYANYYGWNLGFLYTSYGHMVLGGQGIEIDGAGTMPFTRVMLTPDFIPSRIGDREIYAGFVQNFYADMSGRDQEQFESWFYGIRSENSNYPDNQADNGHFSVTYLDKNAAMNALAEIMTLSKTGDLTIKGSLSATGATFTGGVSATSFVTGSGGITLGGVCCTAWPSGGGASIMIVGAGAESTLRCGNVNSASGYFSTVSGGSNNSATGNNSTVSGGWSNCATECYSTLSGGCGNSASGGYSTVSGGYYNNASGCYSVVSGGKYNCACGCFSTLSGGNYNNATEYASVVSGGENNSASGYASTISGGLGNSASGCYSGILGGSSNAINNQCKSFIVGSNITAADVCRTYVNRLEIADTPGELILKSPDGTRYTATIANGGTWSIVAI